MKAVLQEKSTYSCERTRKEYVHGLFTTEVKINWTSDCKQLYLACVAGTKRGRGGRREKGKRKGSACSKSLCFCITPTNFLVIRLRLLSIKCRYTRHCRKTLHSWTKEIRLVIQIQKALWRKLEPLCSRNKKNFTLQKRSKKLRLHQKANPADQKTITTVNRYVCHDLSVWKMRLK